MKVEHLLTHWKKRQQELGEYWNHSVLTKTPDRNASLALFVLAGEMIRGLESVAAQQEVRHANEEEKRWI